MCRQKISWALKGVESISIKQPEWDKSYLDVLDILVKERERRKVRGEGGEIAVANKAFQQGDAVLTSSHTHTHTKISSH